VEVTATPIGRRELMFSAIGTLVRSDSYRNMSFINTTLDSKRKHGMVTFIVTLRLECDTEIKEKQQE